MTTKTTEIRQGKEVVVHTLSELEFQSWLQTNFADMLHELNVAVKHFFPHEYEIKVEDHDRGVISIAEHNGPAKLTVAPKVIEVQSIGSIRQRLGWEVSTWISTPDTRDQPGDIQEVAINNFLTVLPTVREVILNLFRQSKVEPYFETSIVSLFDHEG